MRSEQCGTAMRDTVATANEGKAALPPARSRADSTVSRHRNRLPAPEPACLHVRSQLKKNPSRFQKIRQEISHAACHFRWQWELSHVSYRTYGNEGRCLILKMIP